LTVKFVSDAGIVTDTAPERKAMVPPAPIAEVFEPLTRLTQAIWPGLPVTPEMENGASDSIYFAQAGIPCYGFSAIALERDDVRAHGRDERLPSTPTGSLSISSTRLPGRSRRVRRRRRFEFAGNEFKQVSDFERLIV